METPAVLLVNLGTPKTPKPADLRRFLRTFLSDRRVIETPRVIWKPILEGIVLRTRPRHSSKLYESIWDAGCVTGSPLLYWSEAQKRELQERLGDSVHVELAMRYSDPSVGQVLSSLRDRGFRRVCVIPMYPQYSASTVGSIMDEIARWLLSERNQISVTTVRSFEDNPSYIEALAAAVENYWEQHGRPDFSAGDRLLMSFHSIPQAMHTNGDPYRFECETTAQLLAQRLEVPIGESNENGGAILTYQSVFGPARWIGPATIDTVRALGKAGTRRVDVVCPGFTVDCLETLQEIDMLNRDEFTAAGGHEFHYIPWGNARSEWIDAIEQIVRRELPSECI